MAFRPKRLQREGRTLMIGAIVIVMICVYQFIWSPLMGKVKNMRESVIARSAEHDEAIHNQHGLLHPAKNAGFAMTQATISPLNHLSLATLLSQLREQVNAAHLNTSLTRLTQISNDQVELRFHRVDFDSLIGLITQTVTRQSVSIDSFSVEATEASGIVNANLILKV